MVSCFLGKGYEQVALNQVFTRSCLAAIDLGQTRYRVDIA